MENRRAVWMDNWVLHQPFKSWPQFAGAQTHQRILFRFFETRRSAVVLSSSNSAGRETFEEACRREDIPVLQRRGGGGTVLLGPGCVVLTFAFFAKDIFSNQRYFELINGLWAAALAAQGISGVVMRGHSDLAVGDKKIAGTSLFRRKHLVVYQGSLLVDPDFEQISRVLQHPSREPDYRQGRSHDEFLTSLRRLGYAGSSQDLVEQCKSYFKERAIEHFSDDFCSLEKIPLQQRI